MSTTALDAPTLAKLRAPFTPEAVRWKIQTNPKDRGGRMSKALIVPFIDARLVTERLNDAAPGEWSRTYGQYIAGAVVCRLTIRGSVQEDVGYGVDPKDPEMGVKTAYSDALKRVAAGFGVGASLYASPKQFLDAARLKQMGQHWFLTREAESDLARGYAQWLARKDVADRFGAPIDHGDRLAAPVGDIPTNHDNTKHVAAVETAARDKKLTAKQMNALLDAEGVAGIDARRPTPAARLHDASIPQLVAIHRHIEGGAQ